MKADRRPMNGQPIDFGGKERNDKPRQLGCVCRTQFMFITRWLIHTFGHERSNSLRCDDPGM